MSNVNLDETLFYQYMINNNSTSTMLNAISGNNSQDSGYGNIASVLSALQSSGSWGTGSISDVSTLLGLTGDYSSIGSLNGFSTILQAYMNQNQTGIAEMVEKLEDVLEEAAETEGDTRSYKTVQEIYDYFAEMTSGKAESLVSSNSSGQSKNVGTVTPFPIGTDFDFDKFESETDAMIEATLEEIGM
ncbi:MAG: hypothetical protein J1E62_02165 [Lachnospiraceae bacterium]|nr:hypothetical protein [Lachnospiraceae bacterium]